MARVILFIVFLTTSHAVHAADKETNWQRYKLGEVAIEKLEVIGLGASEILLANLCGFRTEVWMRELDNLNTKAGNQIADEYGLGFDGGSVELRGIAFGIRDAGYQEGSREFQRYGTAACHALMASGHLAVFDEAFTAATRPSR